MPYMGDVDVHALYGRGGCACLIWERWMCMPYMGEMDVHALYGSHLVPEATVVCGWKLG